MAKIVGMLYHVLSPGDGGAIAKTCGRMRTGTVFVASSRAKWLDETKPDVAVVLYNDHGSAAQTSGLDKMPTFSVGAAPEYHNATRAGASPHWRRRAATLIRRGT